ncbi:MAG: ribonuclease D [Chloroflexota bacterium]|nr:MAG: ribonuclease D [Chloroflexota bacterium]
MVKNLLISTEDELSRVVDRATRAGHIAIDTEFVWESTYYPRLGIIQLALSEADCHIVDTLALRELALLGRVLSDPSVAKILHDAQQDLTILHRVTGSTPRNVFDIQQVAGLAGLSATLCLEDLLRETVGATLVPSATRTNWLQRPLSDRQTAYALDDVRYLPAAREKLLARVRDRGREAWMAEELALYDDPGLYAERDPRRQFERVKGRAKLPSRQLAVLRELAAWREDEARQRDLPRGHVVPDQVLLDLAARARHGALDLGTLRGRFDPGKYEVAIVAAIEKGLAAKEHERPRVAPRTARDVAFTARVDRALAYLRSKAIEEGVDAQLVASRAELSALMADGISASAEAHRLLRGWRREFIGDEVLSLCRRS